MKFPYPQRLIAKDIDMGLSQVLHAFPFAERDIFNGEFFDQKLAASENPLKEFREALRQGSQNLKELFHRGVPACELVPARARFIDDLLRRAWARFFKPDTTNLALVAVGGYGRGELHPASDIDVMVLVADAVGTRLNDDIGRFLTFLWDIGLEVSQSVRTLGDCVREATADVTVTTSLMEARLLAGSLSLFTTMRSLTGPDCIWPSRAFFEAKHQEQLLRCHKYHDTAYNLEPNVKEGPGGLRDLQMIGWVAKRHFSAITLHDLVTHGFLTEREYAELIDCQNFLWQVRFALHTLTGRREDVLLFDYQSELARQFGYCDRRDNLAVEQFMQQYYRTIMALSRLNGMLLQLFKEVILLVHCPDKPTPINRFFQARKGYLEVTRPDVFKFHPLALLKIFLLAQQHPELKGIHASTVRLIRDHCFLIDKKFRNDIRAQSLFIKILRQPRGVTQQLRAMNNYGVLAAYLPEFAKIVGRMQFDLFHTYTVDQHILFVVRNLRRFYIPDYSHEFPECSAIIRKLPKPVLLYIAAIYHDIAKGRGGDHSEMGAQDAKKFCRQHGFSKLDTNLVVWLVRNHLAMSLTAQKKDIDDPEVINEFARKMGDQTHLDSLYLLTVADIRGTNPKLWNSWRASLLWQLYETTRRALRRGLGNPIDKEEHIREVQSQALLRLRTRDIDEKRLREIWRGFSDDYFLRYSADEIAWHTRAIVKRADDDNALVLARQDEARGGTEIFIFVRDQEAIFARMVSIMDKLGLTVMDARIITSRHGYTLDSYTVLEASGDKISSQGRIAEIVTTLGQRLNQPDAAVTFASIRTPRILRNFITPTQVNFTRDEPNRRTVIEICTSDRPGLLARIGQAFKDCGVQLQNAKIATIGARAEDIFYVTGRNRKPLGELQQKTLREALVRGLDEAAT
jgi:[protein-PII] uridylyltransferase